MTVLAPSELFRDFNSGSLSWCPPDAFDAPADSIVRRKTSIRRCRNGTAGDLTETVTGRLNFLKLAGLRRTRGGPFEIGCSGAATPSAITLHYHHRSVGDQLRSQLTGTSSPVPLSIFVSAWPAQLGEDRWGLNPRPTDYECRPAPVDRFHVKSRHDVWPGQQPPPYCPLPA